MAVFVECVFPSCLISRCPSHLNQLIFQNSNVYSFYPVLGGVVCNLTYFLDVFFSIQCNYSHFKYFYCFRFFLSFGDIVSLWLLTVCCFHFIFLPHFKNRCFWALEQRPFVQLYLNSLPYWKNRTSWQLAEGLGFCLYVTYWNIPFCLTRSHVFSEQSCQMCTFGFFLHSNAFVFSLVHFTLLLSCHCLTCFTNVLVTLSYLPRRWTGEEKDSKFWITSSSQVSDRAMSSSGCCHLPGSLCDYSGNAEADASKDSEESDSTMQAQYIAKVTAKDGRPLSTVVKAVSLQRLEGEELARGTNQHTVESL